MKAKMFRKTEEKITVTMTVGEAKTMQQVLQTLDVLGSEEEIQTVEAMYNGLTALVGGE